MNLFSNFFTSPLFYQLLFFSTVVCRISDKRKCADADCSVPISLATTLLNYNADDERLLSFPRNVKLKVFSKEAGDTPTLWEVEIDGKRGYVPKGLLREDKVLVPPSKLQIIPTGRTDTAKQNASHKIHRDQEPKTVNLLSATPELPVANSKGLFSTIGGVSADSVPMNSPDIKPQSTRKFQVFAGTTVYDDVVSDKPESPPTIIEDTVPESHEKDKKLPSDLNGGVHDSSVPSPDVKPVYEVIDGNRGPVGNDQNIEKEEKKPSENGEDLKKASHEDENESENTPPESPSEGLLDQFVSTVTAYISSGAGEEVTDKELEEDEEGSAEEEDYEDEEGTSITENPTVKESPEEAQPDGLPLETSTNTSEASKLINDLDESSSPPKLDYTATSKNDGILNQEILKNTLGVESNESPQKPGESSSRIKTEKVEEIKKEFLPSSSDEKEVVPKAIDESESTQSSDFISKEIGKLQDAGKSKNDSDVVFDQNLPEENTLVLQTSPESSNFVDEESAQIPEVEQPKSDVAQVFGDPFPQDKTEVEQKQLENHKSVRRETATEPSEQQSVEAHKHQPKLNSDEPGIQEQSKAVELEFQELSRRNSRTKSITTTDLVMEEPQVKEQSEPTTGSTPAEPSTSHFLFGSRQSNDEEHRNESAETQPPPPLELRDEIKPQIETPNDTVQIGNLSTSDSAFSSLPTLQPVSPKYSSVISRRIQSSESSSVSEILTHPEEEEESDSEHIYETSDGTSVQEETVSPNLPRQSSSPKYSSVVSRQIGSVSPANDVEIATTLEEAPLVEFPESADAPTTDKISADAPTTDKILADVSTTKDKLSDVFSYGEESSDKSALVEKPADLSTIEEKSADIPTTEEKPADTFGEAEVKSEIESTAEVIEESLEVPLQDHPPLVHSDDTADETQIGATPGEGPISWIISLFNVFGNTELNIATSEEPQAKSENLDPSRMSHFAEETCSADGIEGSCPTLKDAMQKEVTWQEYSYTSDMWDLLEKVPLEATIWLVITAVVVLIFSLGHYYIEAHRRDGPLVAVINKLEREVLILKKESCILEDRLQIAQQQLEAWNASSSENDALLMELKQELEETKAAKAELEEQTAQLKEELESVTESGLEMHRLLEESLSSQDGSQVLLSTVETLREKLQRQEDEISGLSHTLSSKNAEVEELQGKLAQAAEVARSLEDKVISVTREKDEEALQLRNKHRDLISQLEEVMETKALEETRLNTEMSKLRLTIEEMQKTLADNDSELETLKEVVKQLRSTDSNEKIEALFDVVAVQARLKTAAAERDDFREKFLEEEGARKLLEGHMKKITQEVADLKNSFETAEKEKIEALTKLQVLSNYFKEKESQLQKELGLQESMWLQKQSDDHTIYEQMRSLREENEKYKLQNESLKKEIVEQESSFKIQLANTEQKAHENWVASRQSERKLKEAQQEAAQLRNRLTLVEKNTANYSLDEKPNISESNGDPSSPPPSLMFPPTTSPPFMMYGPPIPPPGDFVPPPPLMGSPYPSDSRPPPLGRISSPPLDHRFSPPPPLPYPPYDYPPYGHHSPSPPPPMPPHHRNVHKPQPREISREQKDHVPNYSPEAEKTSRRNKR